jgi:Kef-type K+ transport system membrane component KefB
LIPVSEIIHESLFYQLASILLLAGILGFIGLKLCQPLIVAFIATGIVIGPDCLNIVTGHSVPMDLLAKLGVSLLLFTVGLKLDLTLIRTLGRVALVTGMGQMAFTAMAGFLICLAFDFGAVSSLYIAVALSFSSTIIIVKLLSDKREIDSLHGRISLGILIVQDIFVVLCMALLSAFGTEKAGGALPIDILMVFLKGAGLIGFVAFFVTYIATPLMKPVARSPELMVTFAVGWATAFAALVEAMGFSIELGGLLAGIALASTPFRDIVSSRLSGLRDFMMLFFFAALGAKIDLGSLGGRGVHALALSAFTLLGKPLIVMVIMGYMGYKKRTAFYTGLTLGQISEFSLIFIGMGLTLGLVDSETVGLVTLVGLITIALSTYMITYSQHFYAMLEPFPGRFERPHLRRQPADAPIAHNVHYDVVLFGLGRYGSEIARELLDQDASVLGIDFDPDAVRQAKKREAHRNFSGAYGDVMDPDEALPPSLASIQWVICAIPLHRSTLHNQDPRLILLETLKMKGFKGKIAMISHDREELDELKRKGVDLVLTPFLDAARQAVRGILHEHRKA